MPDFSPRRSAMDNFLPQFANPKESSRDFNGASSPTGSQRDGAAPLEFASDSASIWIAAANGNSIADAFAADLLGLTDANGNGHAFTLPSSGLADVNGHAASDDMESAEIELLALDDVATDDTLPVMAPAPVAVASETMVDNSATVEEVSQNDFVSQDAANQDAVAPDNLAPETDTPTADSFAPEATAAVASADDIEGVDLMPEGSAAESIEELVADRELVAVVSGDEGQLADPIGASFNDRAKAAVDPDGRHEEYPSAERIASQQAPLPESAPAATNGAAGTSTHGVMPSGRTSKQPLRQPADLPEHPSNGSLFSPYLVTEIPDLRKRKAGRRSWWRRIFG
jgi:hypothetical protein